jgi:hypothetical protein
MGTFFSEENGRKMTLPYSKITSDYTILIRKIQGTITGTFYWPNQIFPKKVNFSILS